MKQNFAVIILGGTGQVGGAAVGELLAIPGIGIHVVEKYGAQIYRILQGGAG